MTGLCQDKAGLTALDPEPVGEHGGVISAPVRRAGVDLGVEGLQFGGVCRGLLAVEQLERYVGRGHDYLSTQAR